MPESRTITFDIPELRTDFVFGRRPLPIPGDLRIGWRIGLLVLLANGCCRNGRTSLTRLHVLSWAALTEESRATLIAAVNSEVALDSLLVRFEPSLDRAVDFALGEGLLRRTDGAHVALSPMGRHLALELTASETTYRIEREFIASVGFRVTEKFVQEIFRREV